MKFSVKFSIVRNVVLILVVLIMIALTICSTMTAHGATPLGRGLAGTPTSMFVGPAASTRPPGSTQLATMAATMGATQAAATGPDSKVSRIAFVANRDGATNIYMMDPDGKNVVQLTHSSDYKLVPTFSPNGRLIAYLVATTAGKPPILMAMNADGSNAHQINIGKAVAISPPCWSPDSSQIAYISVRSRASDNGLYIIDVGANREHRLTVSKPIDFSYTPPANNVALTDAFAPSWSPDGKSILLFGRLGRNEKTTLFVSTDGKSVRPLLTNADLPITVTDASWSPDGTQILFIGQLPPGLFNGPSIVIWDKVGDQMLLLPPDGQVMPAFPTWSPDGKQIVYAGISSETHKARIYVIDADGSNAHQLTDDTFSEGDAWPSWALVPAELVKH